MKIKAYTPQEYRKIIRILDKEKIKFRTLSKWTDNVHVLEAEATEIKGYNTPHENTES